LFTFDSPHGQLNISSWIFTHSYLAVQILGHQMLTIMKHLNPTLS